MTEQTDAEAELELLKKDHASLVAMFNERANTIAQLVEDNHCIPEFEAEIKRLREVIKKAADKIDSPTRVPRVEMVRELRAALTDEQGASK